MPGFSRRARTSRKRLRGTAGKEFSEMGTERSDRAHEAWRQSTERLDYVQVGLSGALAGYIGKSLAILELGFNGPTVELFAFTAFAASVYCGLRRIERTGTVTRLATNRLYALEMAEQAAGGSKSAL